MSSTQYQVGIVPSGGNLSSLTTALARLGAAWTMVETAEQIHASERLILPGVGAAKEARSRLDQLGVFAALRAYQRPMLGICIGMQLYFSASEEGQLLEPVPLLGLLPGMVRRLKGGAGITLPHMGWNLVGGQHYYFVHSYRVPDGPHVLATATHGEEFPAVIRQDNLLGAQFHPEKSGPAGALFLQEFLRWCP